MAAEDHHVHLIGQVAIIANSIESYLLSIFGCLLGKEDQSEAAIIFSYLETFNRRVEIVNALLERRYKNTRTTLDRWRNLLAKVKNFQRDRNHILHGTNLVDWQGTIRISSPTFDSFVKLSGLKGRNARDRDMSTEELASCVQSGGLLLEEAHRFVLHLSGNEHLLDEKNPP